MNNSSNEKNNWKKSDIISIVSVISITFVSFISLFWSSCNSDKSNEIIIKTKKYEISYTQKRNAYLNNLGASYDLMNLSNTLLENINGYVLINLQFQVNPKNHKEFFESQFKVLEDSIKNNIDGLYSQIKLIRLCIFELYSLTTKYQTNLMFYHKRIEDDIRLFWADCRMKFIVNKQRKNETILYGKPITPDLNEFQSSFRILFDRQEKYNKFLNDTLSIELFDELN